MRYTKQERKAIYLKMAEEIDNSEELDDYICHKLEKVIYGRLDFRDNDDLIYKSFPEFAFFKENDFIWSTWTFTSNSERVICLLFCAEMCK